MDDAKVESIRGEIIEAIKTVEDPEIPINLYDLGLIYDLDIQPSKDGERVDVKISMTLTTPNCPVAESMPMMVQEVVKKVSGVGRAMILLVWSPPWSREKMTEDGRMMMDFLGVSWKDGGPVQPGVQATSLTIGRRKENEDEGDGNG